MILSVELAVLGGGAGKRLGYIRKSQIKIGGETIIQRQVRKLSSLFKGVLYITSPLEKEIELPSGVRRIFDIKPGEGPLIGLLTGLKSTSGEGVFLIGCDMPFIKEELVERILFYAQGGYEIVSPLSEKGPEPLASFYSKTVLPLVEEAYQRGERKLISLFSSAKTYYLGKREVKSIDPDMISFFNINKPSDLEKAQELIKKYV
jgi:molybdopterin-guanine dinucleotide biosynthesis protein A